MEEKLYYTWEYIHRQTLLLVKMIQEKEVVADYIVGISRGGLIPAVLMSHHMGLPLKPLVWSTRDHLDQVHDLTIAEDLKEGKTILLVDDINDSGRTFTEVLTDWEYSEASAGKVITACIFERATTSRPSDFHAKTITINNWVVFPYEPA